MSLVAAGESVIVPISLNWAGAWVRRDALWTTQTRGVNTNHPLETDQWSVEGDSLVHVGGEFKWGMNKGKFTLTRQPK